MSLYRKATPEEIARRAGAATITNGVVNTSGDVLTETAARAAVEKKRDRHRPGYMAAYMRKLRAKK